MAIEQVFMLLPMFVSGLLLLDDNLGERSLFFATHSVHSPTLTAQPQAESGLTELICADILGVYQLVIHWAIQYLAERKQQGKLSNAVLVSA